MSFRAPRRVCFNGNEGMIRPGLHPPWPALRINNNLLLWSSVSYTTRDRVDSFSSTLRRRRNMGELDGWAGAAFLRMASRRCETKGPNKDERPCQLFRCNTGHASRIAMSRVVPREHVRPQTVSADDTVVGYSKETPMYASLRKPEGIFHDSIPGENGVGLRFRAEFFNIFNHPNFGNPTNSLAGCPQSCNPLFGRSTQTLASSLGSGGANGGFNPLYQIGGPRSIQLALKLQF